MSKNSRASKVRVNSLHKLARQRAIMPVTCFANEMINIYPTINPRIMLFSGDMIVTKVVRGDKFDIIYGSFNIFPKKIREVIFASNHARRQLITVKRGQFVHIIGEGRMYFKEVETYGKDGQKKKVKTKYWQLFSYSNSGYFVPKTYDVKQFNKEVDEGNEINYIDEMQSEEKDKFESAVNDILNSSFNDMYFDKGVDNE